MKKQMQQLRRLLFRSKKFNTTTARAAAPETYDEGDDGGNKLSGAFIVVLLLHVVAVVGIFAFARIKPSIAPAESATTQTTAAKAKPAKPAPTPAKPAVAIAAVTPVHATPLAPLKDSIKTPQPGARTTHIVQPGETLGKIAFAFNVGVGDLVAANKLPSHGDIRVGQVLTIPESKQAAKSPTPAETRPATTAAASRKPPTTTSEKKTPKAYVVKKGDTAAKIAREHGCTYDDLVKLNNIKDPKKIQPGQVLKVPVKNG